MAPPQKSSYSATFDLPKKQAAAIARGSRFFSATI
jgi:hypothetical protein